MGGFVTRWPVLQSHQVSDAVLDGDGLVTDQAVRSWVEEVCHTYLERCASLQGAGAGPEPRWRATSGAPGRLLGHPSTVLVSAGVSELYATSFAMTVRLRPLDGEVDTPVDVSETVELVDRETGGPLPVTDAIRDELIALAHTAEHLN